LGNLEGGRGRRA